MGFKYFIVGLLFLYCCFDLYYGETVHLITLQRPVITYFNKKSIKSLRTTSRRYSRQDLKYYLNIYIESLITVDNTFQIDIYVHELIGNRYLTTFIELHAKTCELIESAYFGASMKKALNYRKCPLPPGMFVLENITLSALPFKMPFRQGRMYVNASHHTADGAHIRDVSSYIDLEVKDVKIPK